MLDAQITTKVVFMFPVKLLKVPPVVHVCPTRFLRFRFRQQNVSILTRALITVEAALMCTGHVIKMTEAFTQCNSLSVSCVVLTGVLVG